jgi:hypothetical protein
MKTKKRILQIMWKNSRDYFLWTAFEWLTVGTEVFRCNELLDWNRYTDPYYHVVTDTLYAHNIYFGIFTLPRIK